MNLTSSAGTVNFFGIVVFVVIEGSVGDIFNSAMYFIDVL
jgi:hypothetical protein